MDTILSVEKLVKTYGDRTAVDRLDLRVAPGEIYGFLGPNGAGKTTAISCIAGLLRPTSGRISVGGFDPYGEPKQAKAHIGYVGQEIALYEDLTASENLRYAAALCNVPRGEVKGRVAEMLELVGLSDRSRERVAKFSGGMKRRLHLACGLVHRPSLLLLDEPLAGVDPQAKAHVVTLLKGFVAEGKAILFTTHDMQDAEELCRRIGILDEGKLLAEGTLDQLRSLMGEKDVLILNGDFEEGAAPSVESLDGEVEILRCGGGELVLVSERGNERLPGILHALSEAGRRVERVTVERPGLEALFLKLTGRTLRDRA